MAFDGIKRTPFVQTGQTTEVQIEEKNIPKLVEEITKLASQIPIFQKPINYSPVNGHHPLLPARRAYPLLKCFLSQKDVGKEFVRVYPQTGICSIGVLFPMKEKHRIRLPYSVLKEA